MNFYKVPIGFGMALAVNEPAMNAYSKMTEEQKRAILNKAHLHLDVKHIIIIKN